MELIYTILFFLLGIVLGSVFTTIGLRLPNEESIFAHSYCDKCYHRLRFFEIIPILSYIFLRGKCRYCHKKIDLKHPLIELCTGILYVVTYYTFGMSYELLIGIGIISLLVIICVSDLTYLVIPDEVLIFFSGYFVIVQYFRLGLFPAVKHVLVGLFLFIIMYSIMLIGNKLFKKESLGGGDVKMMFLFGLVLDPLLGTLTIFVGSLLALPISLILLSRHKGDVIPFGPFLVLAFSLIYFVGITPSNILSWLGF